MLCTPATVRGKKVRTVTLAALPKNILKKAENYDATKYKLKPAAVQNLVLLATAREVEEKFGKFGEDETDDYYELEAAVPLEDGVAVPDKALDG